MTRASLAWTFFLTVTLAAAGGTARAQIDPDAVGEDVDTAESNEDSDEIAEADADAEADDESESLGSDERLSLVKTPQPETAPATPEPVPAPTPAPAVGAAATGATLPAIVPISRRPLVLPAGRGGIDVYVNMPTLSISDGGDEMDIADFTDLMFLAAEGRISLNPIEARAGADLLLKQPDADEDQELDTLTRIFAGARVKAGENAAVDGTFAFHHPTEDVQIIELDGTLLYKRPLAPAVAVVAGGGVNFRNILFSELDTEQPFWILRATGNVGVQAQPSDQLMLHGGIELAVPMAANPDEDDPDDEIGTALAPDTSIGLMAGAVYSVSSSFDLYGKVELLDGFSRRVALFDFASSVDGAASLNQTNILFGGRATF